jgi:hypothetical protein
MQKMPVYTDLKNLGDYDPKLVWHATVVVVVVVSSSGGSSSSSSSSATAVNIVDICLYKQ